MNLISELEACLDGLTINGDNIGNIRRSCFVPWNSEWNGVVRDLTAQREKSVVEEGGGEGDVSAVQLARSPEMRCRECGGDGILIFEDHYCVCSHCEGTGLGNLEREARGNV